MDKRYQESNWLVKLWRLRHYMYIPFKWVWYSYIKPFKVYKDEYDGVDVYPTDEYDVITGKKLWSLLVGDAQLNMNWYHTQEEVRKEMDKIVMRERGKRK